MSYSVAPSEVQSYRYDDLTIDSMQPSDEWEGSRVVEPNHHHRTAPDDEPFPVEERYRIPEEEDEAEQETFVSKQTTFVDYISHLTSSFSVEGSKFASQFGATMVKNDDEVPTKATTTTKFKKAVESNHSRCIIENTESIQERRDDIGNGNGNGGEENGHRDQSTMSCSVEEISQISELTMDIHTVVEELPQKQQPQKTHSGCAALPRLPTIHEVKQQFEMPTIATPACGPFEMPTIATPVCGQGLPEFELPKFSSPACAQGLPEVELPKIVTPACAQGLPEFERPQLADATACAEGVRVRTQCTPGTDTTANKNEGRDDIIDYVFGLVEDALCKPITPTKAERNKVFMDAFLEESEKVVKLAKNKDFFRESNSKHSSRSASTRVAGNHRRHSPLVDKDEGDDDSTDIPMTPAVTVEKSTSYASNIDHNTATAVDQVHTHNGDEPTMDWDQMVSLARKKMEDDQKLQDDENSVVSNNSRQTLSSKLSGIASFFTSARIDSADTNKDVSSPRDNKETPASIRTCSSTHATLSESVVNELRELSALDSSSFEEQSRFVLTSSLFQFVRSYIPKFKTEADSERDDDELSIDERQDQGVFRLGDESVDPAKVLLYIAFVFVFIFWPSGVPRKASAHKPSNQSRKKRIADKPTSLLQMVLRAEDR